MPEIYDKDQVEYHYNQEERLAKMPLHLKDRQHGSNKSILITFANLILIFILFGGFLVYERFFGNKDEPEFYHPDFYISLNGYIFDNNMLITLSITKKPETTLPSEGPLPFEASIILSENSEIQRKFFNFLPVGANEEIVLRTSIPITNFEVQRNSKLEAIITYSDQVINLKSGVKSEK